MRFLSIALVALLASGCASISPPGLSEYARPPALTDFDRAYDAAYPETVTSNIRPVASSVRNDTGNDDGWALALLAFGAIANGVGQGRQPAPMIWVH